MKKNLKKSEKINYAKDTGWYLNNHNALGDEWLIENIKGLPGLKQGFVLLSPAANLGYYEKAVYEALRASYGPRFYISDLEKDLKEVTDPEEDFKILPYGTAAEDLVLPNGEKADIILDIKGATWHTTYQLVKKEGKEQLLKLLMHYAKLLKEESSVLLLDAYHTPSIEKLTRPYRKKERNRIRSGKRKLTRMWEDSTLEVLERFLGRKAAALFTVIHRENNETETSLQKQINVAYITKKDLCKLISLIEKKDSRALKICSLTKETILENGIQLIALFLFLTQTGITLAYPSCFTLTVCIFLGTPAIISGILRIL